MIEQNWHIKMFPGQENGSNWKILSMNQALKKCFF